MRHSAVSLPISADLTLITAQIVAVGVLIALLSLLTRAGWTVLRSPVSLRREAYRERQRDAVRPLWVTLAVLTTIAVLLETHTPAVRLPDVAGHGAETSLPHAWQFATAEGADRSYALLTLAGYVCLTQVLVAAVALARHGRPAGWTRAAGPQTRPAELGAALVSTFALLASVLAFVPLSVTGYLHVLAHAHPQTVP